MFVTLQDEKDKQYLILQLSKYATDTGNNNAKSTKPTNGIPPKYDTVSSNDPPKYDTPSVKMANEINVQPKSGANDIVYTGSEAMVNTRLMSAVIVCCVLCNN